MSAVKLIFKRSSILGKRPTGDNLTAGEIGLNTNPTEPGLYFEVNDGSVVKVGPAAYLPQQPTPTPSRGELWVDGDINTLSVGTDLNQWKKVAAPFLGGTNGLTVFVGPDYEFATDSLANDGQTIPFVTINRAVIEVTKQIIIDRATGVSTGNNRYLIVLAPGRHCVVNAPGVTPANFSYDLSLQTTKVTQDVLTSFNSVSEGALIVPRGISIIGMDLKKCEIHPTYVPTYTHPSFPNAVDYQQQSLDNSGIDGPVYSNQPLSSIFRWSGNTYLSNFTCLDKIEARTVVQIQEQENTQYAIFKTASSSGLNLNDFVQINYLSSTDQVDSTFSAGTYYVSPLDSFTFLASPTPWPPLSGPAEPVLFSQFSSSFTVGGTAKLTVSNIYPYFIPVGDENYEISNYSHHRLSVLKNASKSQLDDYYTKVQKAFPGIFGGQVNTGLASLPEYEIVAPAAAAYPYNLTSNSTDNSSPYENMVNHRSDYGMAHGDYDGDLVTGFKSVIINSATAVILQKDPVAYEVYQTSTQDWATLCTIIQEQPAYSTRNLTQIPTAPQLEFLNTAKIPDIRYYYQTLTYSPTGAAPFYSIGLPDPENDFRHFGFRLSGANSFMQAQSTYSIGAAIGVWAKGGSIISLTNATTNFGSVAFQAEGFSGIGTLGGADGINRNFLQTGIVRPLALTNVQAESDAQKKTLSLGSQVQFVGIDTANPLVQLIYLTAPFNPASILPYSLVPGSAVFITDGICTYRAFFVTDGTATCILSGNPSENPYSSGGSVLRVRLTDSTIPNSDPTSLTTSLAYQDAPYIRRFIDPRSQDQKSYGISVSNSAVSAQAPQPGYVLRLNQTGQNLSNVLKRNFQFDPGQYGGYAQIFTVADVETLESTNSTNFNNKISDAAQATNYTVILTLTDSGGGWLESLYLTPFGQIPDNVPTGTYQTYQNKNYYTAENNVWSALYYKTNFSIDNGPTKVTPNKFDSSYVVSSVLERSESLLITWQGKYDLVSNILDATYRYYVLNQDAYGNVVPLQYQVPDSYKLSNPVSYFRGATQPVTEYAGEKVYDNDDGTSSLGLIFTRDPVPGSDSFTVAPSLSGQVYTPMSAPWAATPTFGNPATTTLEVLSVTNIVNPRESLSVLRISNPILTDAIEYVRVISISGSSVTVLRNYYPVFYNPLGSTTSSLDGWQFILQPGTPPPSPTVSVPPLVWPAGSTLTPCISTQYPEPITYDPSWSSTKSAVIRYFSLMGYEYPLIQDYLVPQNSGNRLLLNSETQLSPVDGYATVNASYPVEFNSPSTIVANTHTWQYCGYIDYSRGLPKNQVNLLPRKLSYDFLSTSTFGGKLNVVGSDATTGDIVFGGSLREALTGNYFLNDNPVLNITDRSIYSSPPEIEQPASVLVFSADDISDQFDGISQIFYLTRGGYEIPPGQLSTLGTFVFLGGVTQIPGVAYNVSQSNVVTPYIEFTEAPLAGTSCDIRVVTSEDDSQTLEVMQFTFTPSVFDGITNSFVVSPTEFSLTNLNSFVFLGGVEQNPAGPTQTNWSYTLSETGGVISLDFIGGAPEADTTYEVRGILSGSKYRNTGIASVFVNSVDDISGLFNGTITEFPLTVGGVPLDPTVVNSQNMFVSLGGVIQLPVASSANPLSGLAYTVRFNNVVGEFQIVFATAPFFGTTCNIRVVTGVGNQFITCPLPPNFGDTPLVAGPGVTTNAEGQIIDIDAGLIS
jgi:hypothetical protein